MTLNKTLLTEESLHEGAFMLLTCSSLTRYVRMAKLLAQTSGLRARIESGQVTFPDTLKRAEELWREMLRSKERELAEVELAAILAAIAQASIADVSDLLTRISLIDRPSVTWVSALARRLYQERPTNQEVTLSAQRDWPREVSRTNSSTCMLEYDAGQPESGVRYTLGRLSSEDEELDIAA
jgi:hypothetical protein